MAAPHRDRITSTPNIGEVVQFTFTGGGIPDFQFHGLIRERSFISPPRTFPYVDVHYRILVVPEPPLVPWWKRLVDYLAPEVVYDGPRG